MRAGPQAAMKLNAGAVAPSLVQQFGLLVFQYFGELQIKEPTVRTTLMQQIVVSSAFHDTSTIDDMD
jgi:hypothetical protein